MRNIDVCLSPELIHQYELKGKIVVVVDILRATSCMVSGLATGVAAIKPLADVDICKGLKQEGYYTAGERNGSKVEGFDMGNSPFEYMEPHLKGQKVAVTTTNGTLAIEKSKTADQIIIGAFLNLTAVAKYIQQQDKDVVVVCAAWKGKVNLEDSLFAGALVERLATSHQPECDVPRMMVKLYQVEKNDLFTFVKASSHARRLNKLEVFKDIEFCVQEDRFDVVPVLTGGHLVLAG
ncbi:MAG: 2-phosphosulfolactate phosphatase [Imperialibacter sp.]|uniref:2-phosphosulfolactate phosphatase n=1 Tax=Imperialibacter sp. TaxID=2038411 RepID=UPI0032EEF9F6